MNSFLAIAVAGLLGAVVMLIVIIGLQAIGLTSQRLLASIGSLVTKRVERTSVVGFIIHLLFGVAFAFLYVLVWSYMDLRTRSELLLLGMMTGCLHAIAVSTSIVILFSEYKPLRRYRDIAFNVALTQVVAHIAFGIIVGLTIGIFERDYETLTAVSHAIWPTLSH